MIFFPFALCVCLLFFFFGGLFSCCFVLVVGLFVCFQLKHFHCVISRFLEAAGCSLLKQGPGCMGDGAVRDCPNSASVHLFNCKEVTVRRVIAGDLEEAMPEERTRNLCCVKFTTVWERVCTINYSFLILFETESCSMVKISILHSSVRSLLSPSE